MVKNSIDSSTNKENQSTMSILIVEDNEMNMQLFSDVLEFRGYRTIKAKNGVEALNIAKEQQIDLIVLDVQLPELSGFEVVKWLKINPKTVDIPILAVTAFTMKKEKTRLKNLGCFDVLSKPISIDGFLGAIEGGMRKR